MNGVCIGIIGVLLIAFFAMGGCGGGSEDTTGPQVDEEPAEESASDGSINIDGLTGSFFNQIKNSVDINIVGESFAADDRDVFSIIINNEIIDNNFVEVTANSIKLDVELSEGSNSFSFFGEDSLGHEVSIEKTYWAGSNELIVTVLDMNDQPVDSAAVKLVLGDDPEISNILFADPTGSVVFNNLPNRTVNITAQILDQFGSLSTNGAAGTVTISVEGFQNPNFIDNNDFSLGADGWNIGNANVVLIPESDAASSQDLDANERLIGNMDLVLNTNGIGQQKITRTFVANSVSKTASIRYQFNTTEFPDFFGTEFNDSYCVVLRNQQAGSVSTDCNSMNGLGESAFNSQGETSFRELSVDVQNPSDVIQAEISVSNVGDGQFDSQVVIDGIQEKSLSITAVDLNDINNEDLEFLSVGPHSFFDGKTRINGTIRIQGEPADVLTNIELEIIENGSVVATADLIPELQNQLLVPFGQEGVIEITTSQLLFELDSTMPNDIDLFSDNTINLRVLIDSANEDPIRGDKFTKTVNKLVLTTFNSRFFGRDATNCIGNNGEILNTLCGGDGWTNPSINTLLSQELTDQGLAINDFSNMNGAHFPPHQTHRRGRDIDIFFTGYPDKDNNTAERIIGIIEQLGAMNVEEVYVTYERVDGNPFFDAIKNRPLTNDNRTAEHVIKRRHNHERHFHIRFRDRVIISN